MDHPKIAGLPDGSFRLWVQGMAHCQKFLTDGRIDLISLRALRAYSPKRVAELIAARLWVAVDGGSIEVHDFLEWNDSRDEVLRARKLGKDRRRRYRDRRASSDASVDASSDAPVPSGWVGGLTTPAAENGKGDPGETTPARRAGAFCQWYEDTHDRLFRVGYLGTRNDYESALRLVGKFTDAELRDAALVWFGMDDDFATNGTRTVAKFASRVTACLQLIRAKGIA